MHVVLIQHQRESLLPTLEKVADDGLDYSAPIKSARTLRRIDLPCVAILVLQTKLADRSPWK